MCCVLIRAKCLVYCARETEREEESRQYIYLKRLVLGVLCLDSREVLCFRLERKRERVMTHVCCEDSSVFP